MPAHTPSSSRRGFLALSGAALAGLAGCASVPNGPLPPTAVRLRTRRLPTATVDRTVPVLESHVDAYRARLQETVPAAERRWTDIDTDELTTLPPYTHDDVDATRTYTETWVDYHAARVAAARADELSTVLTGR